jgi:glutaredoxin 3
MKKIVIYSKDNCVYCDKAVKLAQQFQFGDCGLKDVIVKKLDVHFTMEKLMELFPTARTFPQIVVDDENIGGYTELESLFKIRYD